MFAPNNEITRQEAFTMLYKMLKFKGRIPKGEDGNPISTFSDADQIATWAKEAMTLFTKTGIVRGNNGMLFAANTISRAEIAQLLYNVLSK